MAIEKDSWQEATPEQLKQYVEKHTKPKKKRGDTITPKQLKFAKAYVETGNASEAYRRAYSNNKNSDTVRPAASRLLNNNYNVIATVKAMEEKLIITTETQVEKLEKIYQLAMMKEELNPAINAVNSQSKHKGLLNEAGTTVNVNLNTADNALVDVSPEKLNAMLAVLDSDA